MCGIGTTPQQTASLAPGGWCWLWRLILTRKARPAEKDQRQIMRQDRQQTEPARKYPLLSVCGIFCPSQRGEAESRKALHLLDLSALAPGLNADYLQEPEVRSKTTAKEQPPGRNGARRITPPAPWYHVVFTNSNGKRQGPARIRRHIREGGRFSLYRGLGIFNMIRSSS